MDCNPLTQSSVFRRSTCCLCQHVATQQIRTFTRHFTTNQLPGNGTALSPPVSSSLPPLFLMFPDLAASAGNTSTSCRSTAGTTTRPQQGIPRRIDVRPTDCMLNAVSGSRVTSVSHATTDRDPATHSILVQRSATYLGQHFTSQHIILDLCSSFHNKTASG
jgi:hypothetical protein